MPAKKRAETTVSCPHCGHCQREAAAAYSTVCRKCHGHFRLDDVQNPAGRPTGASPRLRQIACFDCGTPLDVPEAASSTMCKRCSSHIDLQDYSISGSVSKNFRTTGTFVIEEKGYVLNSDTIAGDVVLKGRFIGKLKAARLTIHPSAHFKGTFQTEHLVIPAGCSFHWPEPLSAPTTEVHGELVADVHASKALILRAGSRFFGQATAGNLVVESGAILVSDVNIGTPAARQFPQRTPPHKPPAATASAPSPRPRASRPRKTAKP